MSWLAYYAIKRHFSCLFGFIKNTFETNINEINYTLKNKYVYKISVFLFLSQTKTIFGNALL